MILKFKDIEELFEEIESHLNKQVNVYVIGGAVLLHRGLKPSTKDIDLVVDTKEEYEILNELLKKINFKTNKLTSEYEHFDLAEQLKRDDFQLDIFYKKVCSKFSVSKNMIKRSEKIFSRKHLNVFLCSNEDVFAFKTMTYRKGDLDDCISLAKQGLDWKIILEEIKHQIKNDGKDVWITWITERLELLEDEGINIPIMKEIGSLVEEFYDKLKK